MNGLKIFEHERFGKIRALEIDGQPWFVASDVCRVLEIGNSRQAVARLDADEKGVISSDTPGGKQQMNTVNESGLYSLILGSRKKEAHEFKRWVTHEVLPSIREGGGYLTDTAKRAIINEVKTAVTAELAKQKAPPQVDPAKLAALLGYMRQTMIDAHAAASDIINASSQTMSDFGIPAPYAYSRYGTATELPAPGGQFKVLDLADFL